MSPNLEHYICHHDIFWQRTSEFQRRKKMTYVLPVAFDERQLLPEFVDVQTVAAHTGIPADAAQERSTRQRVCAHIVDLGLTAPTPPLSCKRQERVCGINRGQQVPFATRAIGAVMN